MMLAVLTDTVSCGITFGHVQLRAHKGVFTPQLGNYENGARTSEGNAVNSHLHTWARYL